MSVNLTHPEGGSITARDDMAAMYETQGWARAKARKPARKRTTKKSAAPPSTTTNKKG